MLLKKARIINTEIIHVDVMQGSSIYSVSHHAVGRLMGAGQTKLTTRSHSVFRVHFWCFLGYMQSYMLYFIIPSIQL